MLFDIVFEKRNLVFFYVNVNIKIIKQAVDNT